MYLKLCTYCGKSFDGNSPCNHVCPQKQTALLEAANQFSIFNKISDEQTVEAPTGSLRYNTGKPQTNEISPKFLLAMGQVLEKARAKYPRGNWEKGNSYSVPYDSLMRHLLAWQSGEATDSESGLSHLAHAALNLMMLHYSCILQSFEVWHFFFQLCLR